jgi:CheY-like chemotaxis protein
LKEKIEDTFSLQLDISRKKGNEGINYIDFENYDLILMDYNLKDNVKGKEIYDIIRKKLSYIDIVFYSSNAKCIERYFSTDKTEGAFFTEHKSPDFEEKVIGIIQKIIRRSESIHNLRGMVLDGVSELDYSIEYLISKWVEKYESKDVINKKIIEYHNDILKDTKKSNDLLNSSECQYTFFTSSEKNMRIFDSSRKARLLQCLIDDLESKGLKLNTPDFYKNFEKEIIIPRNIIAHVKSLNQDVINKLGLENKQDLHKHFREVVIKHKKLLDDLLES